MIYRQMQENCSLQVRNVCTFVSKRNGCCSEFVNLCLLRSNTATREEKEMHQTAGSGLSMGCSAEHFTHLGLESSGLPWHS